MTNKKFLITSLIVGLIFFTFLPLHAQGPTSEKKYTITGKVMDDELNVPLEYATISIVDVTDSKNINGGVTNAKGEFSIEVAEGTYNIIIEFISYQSKTFSNRTINDDLDLGTIKLGMGSENLDEVVVRAETTQVDIRLDKKIYNIGKDLTTAGGTVSDALNNVPSVTVDIDGTISLRGNENVKILINGKPSAMAGYGSTDVLQQLPADAIEKVEVITSPSARYGAEGTAGILNIILRKEKTLGFNGSLTVNGGIPANAGVSANVNYRTDKFNIFNTTGYRYFEAPGNGYFDTKYKNAGPDEFDRIIEDRDMQRLNNNFNTNLGMEYYLSDESSLTGSIFYRGGKDRDKTTNVSDYFQNSEKAYGSTRTERETQDEDEYQIALNYMNKLDDNGQKLTADFQYENSKENTLTRINEVEDYNDIAYDANLFDERITNDENQNEYLLQADYVLPFGEDSKSQFEAGYRGNWENTVTDYKLYQENENGELVLNTELTNIFDYTENVNAFYTQYGSKLGDFSFLLGLRLENTQLKGKIDSQIPDDQLEQVFGFAIDTDFDNNYLGLFPTVNLIYALGEDENITLGYNRRINRPRGWFINPFPSRSSNNNIFQGNPNLQPAYSNAFDLGYLKEWEKLTLSSSVYYQHETNSFERIQQSVEGTNIIRTIPVNLSTNDRIGGELGLLYNPEKWLRLNGSFNFYQFETKGDFGGRSYDAKNTSYFARFSSKVTLPAQIDWQTNAFYRGAAEDVQGSRDGMFSLDLAFSKDILNNNATLSVNVRDLLNSRKYSGYTVTDEIERYAEFQWRRGQSVNLSFIYRFNQQKKRQEKRGEGGDDMMDEGQFK